MGGGGNFFFIGTISLRRVVVPSPKIVINLSFQQFSEILRYKHTDRQTDILLLLYKDIMQER